VWTGCGQSGDGFAAPHRRCNGSSAALLAFRRRALEVNEAAVSLRSFTGEQEHVAVAAKDAAAASTTIARSGLVGEEEGSVAGGLALVPRPQCFERTAPRHAQPPLAPAAAQGSDPSFRIIFTIIVTIIVTVVGVVVAVRGEEEVETLVDVG